MMYTVEKVHVKLEDTNAALLELNRNLAEVLIALRGDVPEEESPDKNPLDNGLLGIITNVILRNDTLVEKAQKMVLEIREYVFDTESPVPSYGGLSVPSK